MRVAARLESIVAEQAATIDKLSLEREQYRKLYMELLERCAILEKGIVVGKKAERFKGQDAQLTLQMLEMLLAQEDGESAAPEPAENETEKVREHERKKPGRRSLPEHLPRVEIEVLPPEVQRRGLDAFKRVGEEVREVLERRPASMVVVQRREEISPGVRPACDLDDVAGLVQVVVDGGGVGDEVALVAGEQAIDRVAVVLDAFFQWCDEQAVVALDDTPISKAIGYARNQRVALCRFLDDGRLPLDNNISERHLRRQVLGRKNWLFLGSDEGARVNTIFVSLLASCQLHAIDPWAYLRDIFCLLHTWPASRVLELAPAFWKQTLQQQDTQQRLAANVFRTVTLAEHHANV